MDYVIFLLNLSCRDTINIFGWNICVLIALGVEEQKIWVIILYISLLFLFEWNHLVTVVHLYLVQLAGTGH